jgi:hypothetical protein
MSETGSAAGKKEIIEEYSNSEEGTASVGSEKTNDTSLTVKPPPAEKKEEVKQSALKVFYTTVKNRLSPEPIVKISKNYQIRKRDKINRDISWFYWKKYVASAFWSHLSTPVNLSITLLTALTTAQANAPELLDPEIYKKLTIATLILTVVNTFFKPHEKAQHNKDYMKRWNTVGIEFEKVYYSKKNNIMNSYASSDEAVDDYEKIEDKVNELRQKEGPDVTNFFVDFIHILCHFTCLKKYKYWVKMDDDDLENGQWY